MGASRGSDLNDAPASGAAHRVCCPRTPRPLFIIDGRIQHREGELETAKPALALRLTTIQRRDHVAPMQQFSSHRVQLELVRSVRRNPWVACRKCCPSAKSSVTKALSAGNPRADNGVAGFPGQQPSDSFSSTRRVGSPAPSVDSREAIVQIHSASGNGRRNGRPGGTIRRSRALFPGPHWLGGENLRPFEPQDLRLLRLAGGGRVILAFDQILEP